MEKYLIEIFGVYGKGDADKEVELNKRFGK